MQRWEYYVVRFPVRDSAKFDGNEVTSNLNEWGALGWELVSTETINANTSGYGGTVYFVATLKRPLGGSC